MKDLANYGVETYAAKFDRTGIPESFKVQTVNESNLKFHNT